MLTSKLVLNGRREENCIEGVRLMLHEPGNRRTLDALETTTMKRMRMELRVARTFIGASELSKKLTRVAKKHWFIGMLFPSMTNPEQRT